MLLLFVVLAWLDVVCGGYLVCVVGWCLVGVFYVDSDGYCCVVDWCALLCVGVYWCVLLFVVGWCPLLVCHCWWRVLFLWCVLEVVIVCGVGLLHVCCMRVVAVVVGGGCGGVVGVDVFALLCCWR